MRSSAHRHGEYLALLLIALISGCSTEPRGASMLIGPDGGSVTFDEVTVSIPPGALADPVTIAIAPSASPTPDGYRSNSRIYEFRPRGLIFALPIEVSFAGSGIAADSVVVWTTQDESGWESLGGSGPGGHRSALATHFSLGFAGAPTAPTMDGGDGDGGADAAADAGADAAADAGADAAADAATGDAGCALPACALPACLVSSATSQPLVLDAPSQITLWYSHTLVSDDRIAAIGACDGSCVTTLAYPTLYTAVLPAGEYVYSYCSPTANLDVEAPVAPPANATCATAATLPFLGGAAVQPRVVDGGPVYFRIDIPASSPPWGAGFYVNATSDMTLGSITAEVRTTCADPSSVVASGTVPEYLGTLGTVGDHLMPLDAVTTDGAAHTVWVVVTDITPGLRFQLSVGL